jgi:hypothetical protein
MEIDVALLTPCHLRELQFRELFIPVGEGDRFLRGRVDDDQVLMSLDRQSFEVSLVRDWDRPSGLKVGDLRFVVETESAVQAECSAEQNGSLVRGPDGLFIVSAQKHWRYAMALDAGEGPTKVNRNMAAFRKWRIATGERENEVTLFERG